MSNGSRGGLRCGGRVWVRGSVAALRLAEEGYRVGVLEVGRRFADKELATMSWQLPKFLWAPALGCYEHPRIRLLRDLVVLAGAGGGFLNYTNTPTGLRPIPTKHAPESEYRP